VLEVWMGAFHRDFDCRSMLDGEWGSLEKRKENKLREHPEPRRHDPTRSYMLKIFYFNAEPEG
jgi:hypothetical protein